MTAALAAAVLVAVGAALLMWPATPQGAPAPRWGAGAQRQPGGGTAMGHRRGPGEQGGGLRGGAPARRVRRAAAPTVRQPAAIRVPVVVRRRLLGPACGSAVAMLLVPMATAGCGIAAGIACVTAIRLVRRAREAGRRRRDRGELAAMLRRLSRDLRAGADPGDAAAHAMADASPAVAGVLADLATRPGGALPGPGGALLGPGAAGGLLADVRGRLGSGWDLSARHGVPLAAVVATIADDLADRSRAAQERDAQVAGPAVSGYVLAALPAAALLLGAGMGAHPVAVLTGSTIGSALLVAGTALCCGGLLWADRIVRG